MRHLMSPMDFTTELEKLFDLAADIEKIRKFMLINVTAKFLPLALRAEHTYAFKL